MKDVAHLALKDWLALGLAGLGVTFPPHHYIGGLLLALSGAAFAMKLQPEDQQVELWVTALGAWIVATLAAIAVFHWRPAFPPQIVMAAAGFLSRYAARFVLAMAGKLESRSDTLFDRILDRVLPVRKPGDDR